MNRFEHLSIEDLDTIINDIESQVSMTREDEILFFEAVSELGSRIYEGLVPENHYALNS